METELETRFYLACMRHSLEEVRQVVAQQDFDVNSADRPGIPRPLVTAITSRHPDICRLLIEQGAQVNAVSRHGQPMLHHAVQVGCPDTAAVLLQHGADVHAVDAEGRTALDNLLLGNRAQDELAILLVAAGAQAGAEAAGARELRPELRKVIALPPVHAAAVSGQAWLLLQALDKAQDPLQPGPDGCTVEDTCRRCGHPELLDLYRSWAARRSAYAAWLDEKAAPSA